MSASHLTILLLLIFAWSAVARAEDWPQFRGPRRDGTWRETQLIQSFPASGLRILWRQPAGWGWSSPVVERGRVFLTDSELEKPLAKERIRCFDATTGEPLWSFSYPVAYPDWAFTPGQGGGPTPTPIVQADKVYMLGGNGHVHCVDARKGLLVWRRDLGKSYEIGQLACRPSPLIEGNLLILFVGAKPGATLIALDKRTGKEVWKALDEPVSNSSPIIITAGGKRQLIVWTGESVTSLEPATGRVYWREPMVTSNNDAIPTPVVAQNRLLIGGLMLELSTQQPAATVLWPESKALSKRILSHTSTALLQGDQVYSAKSTGELVCLDASTGYQVWEATNVTRLGEGASIHLTAIGDGVLLFTDQGDLIRAQLQPEGYRETCRAHLLEPTTPFGAKKCAWVPPAFANRCVFARNDQELVCASLGSNANSR